MKKINETFVCLECGKTVPPAEKTSRNHCPYCFASQHVDGEIPGDRKAVETCGGAMYPRAYEIANGKTKILFQCAKCGKEHRNKVATDDNLMTLDEKIVQYRPKFAML